MSSSAILLATLAIVVSTHARFIAPIRPLLPMPMPFFGPIHPPMITPFVRPIIPFAPPIFPIIRERRVTTSSRIARPRSKPFVIDEPRVFLPREEEPVFINLVDNRDPIRDVVYIEDKRQPMYERPRYIEDSNNGDISIDGNVYISDPYAVNNLQRGASVGEVVSRTMGAGQLAVGDNLMGRGDNFDYPVPSSGFNVNVPSGPVEPIINSRPITII